MKPRRASGERMTRTVLLAAIAAAWSCDAPEEKAPVPEPLPVTRITACPEGAQLIGDAPPRGLRQRCQIDDSARHGASREWYENRRERTYTEWWEGQKHGQFRLWYENGQLRGQGHHRHGEPAGEWVYYGEDGRELQRRTFSVAAPGASWLADAIAGRPPVKEPNATDQPDDGATARRAD
jgi:hypothetical protein